MNLKEECVAVESQLREEFRKDPEAVARIREQLTRLLRSTLDDVEASVAEWRGLLLAANNLISALLPYRRAYVVGLAGPDPREDPQNLDALRNATTAFRIEVRSL